MPRKGSTTARGYGSAHQAEREAWRPKVEAGTVDCWRCHRPIRPGTPWHLGHDDHDRTIYRGPEHERCNTQAAARMRGKNKHAKTLTPQRVSRTPIEEAEW